MCNLSFVSELGGNELRKEVNKAVAAFTDNFSEFTAHDVTTGVREAVGSNVEVVHSKVRALVHEIMAGAFQYEEFLKDFGNGLQARAYRSTVAGNCVPNTNTQSIKCWSIAKTPTAAGITKPNQVTGKAFATMKPKSEGRVTIPSSALKKTGLYGVTKSGFVYLHEDGINLVVDDNIPGERYKLDKHGSFRLRSNHVKNFKQFAVYPHNGSLVIVRS